MQTLPAPTSPDALLTEREAASLLRISQFTLARFRKSGQLAYHLIGGQIRYLTADVLAYRDGARRPSDDNSYGDATELLDALVSNGGDEITKDSIAEAVQAARQRAKKECRRLA